MASSASVVDSKDKLLGEGGSTAKGCSKSPKILDEIF